MRKALLISLSLVLALVACTTVCADDGFYVIPTMRGNYAPIPQTGQTKIYAAGDDGTFQKGVASPTPRFTDNNNGTVTDNLTGLIWMKNANAFGQIAWNDALTAANGLSAGYYGLTDGSKAGDWRLPNLRELQSLLDYGRAGPALPANHPFTGVQTSDYWSSTSYTVYASGYAWHLNFAGGQVDYTFTPNTYYVWCVRGGK